MDFDHFIAYVSIHQSQVPRASLVEGVSAHFAVSVRLPEGIGNHRACQSIDNAIKSHWFSMPQSEQTLSYLYEQMNNGKIAALRSYE